jgi:hypothetical protein
MLYAKSNPSWRKKKAQLRLSVFDEAPELVNSKTTMKKKTEVAFLLTIQKKAGKGEQERDHVGAVLQQQQQQRVVVVALAAVAQVEVHH